VAAPEYQSTDGRHGVYLLAAATGSVIGFLDTPGVSLFGQAVFSGNDLVLGSGAGLGLTDYQITTPGPPLTLVTPPLISTGATGTVWVTGSGLGGSPSVFVTGGGASVARVTVHSPTSLSFTVVVDANATIGTRNVSVVEPGSPSTDDPCSDCLTLVAAPTLTSVTPASLARGTTAPVTVTGTGFAPGARLTGPDGVTFSTPTVVDPTTITATVTVSATAATGSGLPVRLTDDRIAGNGKVTARVLTVT
jgi:hypothetical protein